ncbi:MAG TPA: hypothetical protein VMS22_05135 [Candidatus Eisenbacteria bacterium]|nr:hypothetical protein [Candidatus Eisenbacteria bacterium]
MASDPEWPRVRVDADGVRIVETPDHRPDVWIVLAVGVVLIAGIVGLWPSRPQGATETARAAAPAVGATPAPPRAEPATGDAALPHSAPATRAGKIRALRKMGVEPRRGPDGKREYAAKDVIGALRAAGVRDGIAAFEPPGTDPPKPGIIVPDDWVLPEGYVRHYQVTDDGQQLPPILMFHPDYEFVDEQGNAIAVPADRIVPPDLAPPGLVVRMLEVPSPDRPR